ncbi:integrase catalytic domain-containing protein [Klebsiella pneumoniae]
MSGVNPQGQQPNSLWQSDFTHCSLGKFSLLFVSVDTFSGFIWAVPVSSESNKHAISTLLLTFPIMGIPSVLINEF